MPTLSGDVSRILLFLKAVVYLAAADKDRGLTRRPLQEQKGLDKRTLIASQQPFHPW